MAMRQLSISVYFVKAVLKHAVSQGLEPAALLRLNRISPRLLEENDARISIERFADLQVAAMLAMGDESLGYGEQRLPIGSWSMMCYAVIGCDTLGQALARYCRFFGLFMQPYGPQLRIEGGRAMVQLGESDAPAEHYSVEHALFNCHRFGSWLVQEHLPLIEVHFQHSAPPHIEEYRHMFLGSPVMFDQPHTQIVFNEALLGKPVTQNEQSLTRFLRHPVLALLSQQYDQASWTSRVRQILRGDLTDLAELDAVAQQLELHPQTLRRRLNKEGSSFSEIKSLLRRDVALHYLGKQGLSIEEIAHRAGFSESSAFIRAFKGWTGVTPYTYRKGV
ncbi:AraC family transcriptional regulator [Halieaceae bacterium IMCC14734]|uniref:AraC family transcriptional regulator n=2 Tax=Candidatus Litorirhabdus singularis TaxID=2518993 RepID=A0ABT3TFK6_9GAMM|nr:AraC family transcriptional regulator [Candidatus Litorirhabdus singularis]